ncbi:MAG: hypothetical protein ACI93G_001714 [Hyphomonas sp.]|jgi:hypothetical protein
MRFLDMPLPPPGLFDYPLRDSDLLPARPLIQRLHTLRDVWDNPAYYITAMRRRLSCKVSPIRNGLRQGFKLRSLTKRGRDTARQFRKEAVRLVPQLDTS